MNVTRPDEPEDAFEDTAPGSEVPDELPTAAVPEELAGKRLDVVAAQLFSDHSRSRLQGWIADGNLLLNGERIARGRDPVKVGDVLTLTAEPPTVDYRVEAQDLPLTVIYSDATLAIVYKPAGLTTHPGAGQPNGTLQNALLHHFPQTAVVPRAGIVHRLDKDTSGLLVVALTPTAHTALVAALAAREISREYDAVVAGDIVAGNTVNAPIGRHPRDRLRMAVATSGRRAVSHYRVQERFEFHTHLRVKLETGRTHQIRVHMTHIRHPIVGDALYGGRIARGIGMTDRLRAALLAFPRQALHARELELVHPVSGKLMRFTSEPPEDIQGILALLREDSPQ